MKRFFVNTLLFVLSLNSYSQTYNYYPVENTVKISECILTSSGFQLNGSTITKTSNNDKFTLNTELKKFYWSDNKGSTNQEIYELKSKVTSLNTQYVFNTVTNIIRITTNSSMQAIVEIFMKQNGEWLCLSYLCNVYEIAKKNIGDKTTPNTKDTYFVISDKAYFYSQPDYNYIKKAYLVRGEKFVSTIINNGFVYVDFTNSNNVKTLGWIKLSEVSTN